MTMALCFKYHALMMSGFFACLVIVSGITSSCHGTGMMIHDAMARAGGRESVPVSQNGFRLEELAEYAVNEYNHKQKSHLKFVKLVSAEQQVVAGLMYYLVLEATSGGGQTQLYEAKVWVKPWEDFKSLEGFTPINGPSCGTGVI